MIRPAARAGEPSRLPLVIPVLAGAGTLLLRVWILRTPADLRVALLVTIYGSILAVGLLVPVSKDRARMDPRAALGLGLAGIFLAAVGAGRPVAAPLGASALALSLMAAVAEEALFRRAAYGWLSRYGAAVAIVGSAALFASIHVPLYGIAALPLDLGAGLLLSWQRWAAGTWTVPAATHATANLLAVVLR